MIGGDGQQLADDGLGFLDVAANALAIILLATMLILQASAAITSSGEAPTRDTSSDLALPERHDMAFPPFARYHIVMAEGVAPIDLDALTRQFKPGSTIARGEQGMLTASIPTTRRDYDVYQAQFTADLDHFRAIATKTDEAAAVIMADIEQNDRHPTFVVAPDGIDTFAALYWQLRESGATFRWYPMQGNTIRLSRHPRNYARRTTRW